MAGLDIVPADKEKWYLKLAMKWFIKKYSGGKNGNIIHEEMEQCGNPIIRFLLNKKEEIVDNIKEEEHQIDVIDNMSEFLLWVLYKDTAYRQIFFWALKQLMDEKENLMPKINEYYREPKDWYVNVWHDSKQKTKKQRESGELSENGMSMAEQYFVPKITQRRIEEELEKERKKKGW